MSVHKILFICGSLKPGKDGVGDYTRKLASQLTHCGLEVALVALYDKGIAAVITEIQTDQDILLKTLRIPESENNIKRYKLVQEFIDVQRPDIISLQYVPYSFNRKGVPLKLTGYLQNLKGHFKWHIMFHELYIPVPFGLNKMYLISQLQIKVIKGLITCLKPIRIHTSNSYYSDLLTRIQIDAKVLGLFSNIKGEPTQILDELINFNTLTTAVYFASLPNENLWNDQLAAYKRTLFEKSLLILVCGFRNAKTDKFVSFFSDSGFQIKYLEGLSSENLIELFSKASFGVSRVPQRLIGKSGAAVAMLEQGLPLWVPIVENTNYHSEFRPELCFTDLNQLLEDSSPTKIQVDRLSGITRQFIADIGIKNIN